jgi:hypothetical protein
VTLLSHRPWGMDGSQDGGTRRARAKLRYLHVRMGMVRAKVPTWKPSLGRAS